MDALNWLETNEIKVKNYLKGYYSKVETELFEDLFQESIIYFWRHAKNDKTEKEYINYFCIIFLKILSRYSKKSQRRLELFINNIEEIEKQTTSNQQQINLDKLTVQLLDLTDNQKQFLENPDINPATKYRIIKQLRKKLNK